MRLKKSSHGLTVRLCCFYLFTFHLFALHALAVNRCAFLGAGSPTTAGPATSVAGPAAGYGLRAFRVTSVRHCDCFVTRCH